MNSIFLMRRIPMIDDKEIKRINELAKKAKAEGLNKTHDKF